MSEKGVIEAPRFVPEKLSEWFPTTYKNNCQALKINACPKKLQ